MVLGTLATAAAGSIISDRNDSGGGGGNGTVVIAPPSQDGQMAPLVVNTGSSNRTPLREKLILIGVLAVLLAFFLYAGWLYYNAAVDRLEDLLDVFTGIFTGGIVGAFNPWNRALRKGRKRANIILNDTWDGTTKTLGKNATSRIFRLFGGGRR